MATRKKPDISARKPPSQARSTRLVADILEAADRVLALGGATSFTAARVAETAGISVGSLYQYFPNKEAILFRLQADEWRDTRELLEGILADSARSPFERLREAVRAFFATEWHEAKLRATLDSTAPAYRNAPEAAYNWAAGKRCILAFMADAIPNACGADREFAADMVLTVMSAVAERATENAQSESDVNAMAVATGDMLCAYLRGIE